MPQRIESFDLRPGRRLAGKYVVESLLGRGWEGEVYKVTESRTGASRAAKLFFPHRNERDAAVNFYARKLEALRDCPIVIKYHHSDTVSIRKTPITVLFSEYVDGQLLGNLVAGQRGKRLQTYEALHLLYALSSGLEQIHNKREYHGDMHAGNIIVRRKGITFDVKLVDLFHWGRPSAANIQEDVINLVRVFYDTLGGAPRYRTQPPQIKAICRGLRRDLIKKDFPTARHLRHHLENFEWDEQA